MYVFLYVLCIIIINYMNLDYFNTENQGDHLHALRGHLGWRAEARSSGTYRQRYAGHHDHHERRLLQQVPERTAASHCQIGKLCTNIFHMHWNTRHNN